MVGRGAADDRAGAVLRSVGGLHGDLGLAVAVVVVHLELCVVRPGADVAAQVDAPQPGAVELEAVDDRVAGVAGLGVVLGVGGLPLQGEVQGSVAVKVADGGVIGLVGVGHAVGGRAACGRGDRDVLVAGAELDRVHRVALLHAVHDRADGVVGVGGGAGVEVVRGAGDRGGVDLRTGPVDVERHVVRVGAEPAPADQVAAAGVDADHAPVELLDLPGGGRLCGVAGGERGQAGAEERRRAQGHREEDTASAVPVRVFHGRTSWEKGGSVCGRRRRHGSCRLFPPGPSLGLHSGFRKARSVKTGSGRGRSWSGSCARRVAKPSASGSPGGRVTNQPRRRSATVRRGLRPCP